jgi:gliding motility-associated-like protein
MGDTIGNTADLIVTDSGPFIYSVTGPNGCIATDTLAIPVDTISPDAVIELQGEIRCQERDVVFSGSQSTPGNVSYLWSTAGGTIVSDPAQEVISAQDTGLYYLMVTDLVNGCQNTDSFHLLPNPEDIVGAVINVIRPVCAGEFNGAIEVESMVGGIGPFLFQLPPGPPQVSGFFDGLGEGQHLLIITDAAGCEYDTLVEIPATPGFTVSAGDDIEIYLGEIATLEGTSDLPVTELQAMSWDSLGSVLCAGCSMLDVSPWESTTYVFTMQSVTGCVRSDEVQVFVIEKAKYYLPNIFSPNGDGINDELRIYPAAGMARVMRWIIFDRWGNAVFGATDFDPNDQGIYWNGITSTGETANPAVFPYLLEIQLINGNRELLHGDITLIR